MIKLQCAEHTWRLAMLLWKCALSRLFSLLAKASCTSCISAASDFVADVGEQIAQRSGGLLNIARCSKANPERDVHRVLVKKFALSLKLERTQLGDWKHIPILPIQTWFDFFVGNSCMHILHGLHQPHPAREEAILSAFWRQYQQLHPQHQIFQEASSGALSLSRAIPLVLHGDEGRGRKHSAHFVMSFHSLLGFGFGNSKRSGLKRDWTKMECNFSGHTFTNRFLIASLRKRDYADDESETWQTLMDTVARDARYMWETGVKSEHGPRYWGVVLGIIGDWPFLHKCGSFSRSFNNIQKRVNVRSPPVGICHMCKAGQSEYPFEQIETRRPAWLATEFVQDPFLLPSPFATHLLHEPGKEACLWNFDWFHTMHLGVLKYFLGSVLALLSEQEDSGQVDGRFSALSAKYRLWCHQNSQRAHVTKISKESIGWDTTSSFPTGTWHKGSLSTVLMNFVEAKLSSETFPNEPLLGLAADACKAIQQCSRIIYRSSLWLEPAKCKLVAECGFQFLRRYAQSATLAKNNGRCLFIFQPKLHCLHHFMVSLWDAHQRNIKGFNPLWMCCQQSEDFIGRPSRLTRRVTAQMPVLHRVMDRYLQSTYHQFISSGYLVRPGGRWQENQRLYRSISKLHTQNEGNYIE